METMWALANPTSVVEGGDKPEIPAAALAYVQDILKVSQPAHLQPRDQREMETLVAALDMLCHGDLAQLGDVMMQRFKAIEVGVRDKAKTDLSRHRELLPRDDIGVTSTREREIAAKLELRGRKLRTRTGG